MGNTLRISQNCVLFASFLQQNLVKMYKKHKKVDFDQCFNAQPPKAGQNIQQSLQLTQKYFGQCAAIKIYIISQIAFPGNFLTFRPGSLIVGSTISNFCKLDLLAKNKY